MKQARLGHSQHSLYMYPGVMCNEDDFLVLKKNRKRQIPERAALMLTHIDFGS